MFAQPHVWSEVFGFIYTGFLPLFLHRNRILLMILSDDSLYKKFINQIVSIYCSQISSLNLNVWNSKIMYLCYYKPQKLWFLTAATEIQYRFSHGLETRDNGLEWALQTKTLPLNLHFFLAVSGALLPLTPNCPSRECPLIILLHV